MKHLVKVWLMMAKSAAQSQLLTSFGGLIFIIGKVVRFLLYFIFLFSVISQAGKLAGYSASQAILFFLVFSIVDVVAQFLFRGVYVFRPLVISGNYDLDLLKPLPSWFRPLFGWTDILDLITLPPLLVFTGWYVFSQQLFVSWLGVILFLLLLVNSILVSFAFHLFVSSICVLTTQIDHLIWVYRDLKAMGRFPTDIYSRKVKLVLTFIVPVVVLVTVPAKALLGLLSWSGVLISFLVGFTAAYLSLRFWFWSLRHYTSASS